MKKRPNVLLICCDQLRPDAFGYAGNRHIQTPHINELAAAGVSFRNAISECPVCLPARKIMMTGRNAYENEQFDNFPPTSFPDRGPFLAECFSKAGYQTQAIGKMHVSPPRFRAGFDHILLNEEGRRHDGMRMDDYADYLREHGMLDRLYEHGMPANGFHSRPGTLPEEHDSNSWVAREAARFLQRRDTTAPFFLYASFRDPHPPLCPPQFYWDLYKDKPVHEPVRGDWLGANEPPILGRDRLNQDYDKLTETERQQAIRAYYGMITHIDHRIGSIMGQLGSQWLTGDTIVVFLADHGEMLFDHDAFCKSKFYRSSAGIPFVIMPPGNDNLGIQTSSERDEPVMLQDLMPTLLDLCDIPVPETCTGKSLAPLLRDPQATIRDHAFGRHATQQDAASYVIQDKDWKYLYFVEGGVEQLFDVRNDYYDCHDLSAKPEHTERLANYRRKLIEELEAVGDSNAVNGKLRAAEPRLADPSAPRRYKNNGTRGYYWPSSPDMNAAPPESYRGLYADEE